MSIKEQAQAEAEKRYPTLVITGVVAGVAGTVWQPEHNGSLRKGFIEGAQWAATQSPWISVTPDTMPKEEDYDQNNEIFVIDKLHNVYLFKKGDPDLSAYGFIAWMPIPTYKK